MDCSLPGSSHGIFQARVLEWGAIAFSRKVTVAIKLKDDYSLDSSGTQACHTLCDPMDCSTPGLLSITNSQSLLNLIPIESVMPSNHLILCFPLLRRKEPQEQWRMLPKPAWTSPRLTSIQSVMPSNHLILCHPLLLLPSIPLPSKSNSLEVLSPFARSPSWRIC